MTCALRATMLIVAVLHLTGCITAEEADQAASDREIAAVVLSEYETELADLDAERADTDTTPDRIDEIDRRRREIETAAPAWLNQWREANATVEAYNQQESVITGLIYAAAGSTGVGTIAAPWIVALRRKWLGTIESVAQGGGVRDPGTAGSFMEKNHPKLRRQIRRAKNKHGIRNVGS